MSICHRKTSKSHKYVQNVNFFLHIIRVNLVAQGSFINYEDRFLATVPPLWAILLIMLMLYGHLVNPPPPAMSTCFMNAPSVHYGKFRKSRRIIPPLEKKNCNNFCSDCSCSLFWLFTFDFLFAKMSLFDEV